MSEDWKPERTAALMALWNEGLPASEIGRRLGVTKNAVVGKVHRLGLPKRQSPIPNKPRPVVAEVVKLDTLGSGMCSWPEGEPGQEGFHFCGKPSVPGKPYCEDHCARAYVKPSKDKKDTAAA